MRNLRNQLSEICRAGVDSLLIVELVRRPRPACSGRLLYAPMVMREWSCGQRNGEQQLTLRHGSVSTCHVFIVPESKCYMLTLQPLSLNRPNLAYLNLPGHSLTIRLRPRAKGHIPEVVLALADTVLAAVVSLRWPTAGHREA